MSFSNLELNFKVQIKFPRTQKPKRGSLKRRNLIKKIQIEKIAFKAHLPLPLPLILQSNCSLGLKKQKKKLTAKFSPKGLKNKRLTGAQKG